MNRCVIVLAMAFLVCLTVCSVAPADTQDTQRFRQEHESLNGQPASDGLHNHPSMELHDSISVEYAQFSDVEALLTSGTGVLYMGFPECPWCRVLLPELFEAMARAECEAPIRYYNALDQRDILSLDDMGNTVTEREATPEYRKLVERLYDWLTPYEGLDDPMTKRIYFPTVVFVRDGVVQSTHIGTLPEQLDPYTPLEPEQYATLVDRLTEQFAVVYP